MKTICLSFILFFLISSAGCGGGGTNTTLPPSERDLSGLEGTWNVDLSYTGTLTSIYGDEAISDSGVGSWILSQNSINAGFPLEWNYNGTTLNIVWTSTTESTDPVCGKVTTTVSAQLQINITPGSQSATISGSGTVSRVREKCNDSTGLITYTGSMSL